MKMTFERDLHAWDELLVVTFAEVADERGRADRFHKEAQEATARMREHRKQGDAVSRPSRPAPSKRPGRSGGATVSPVSSSSGRSRVSFARFRRPS